MYIIERKADIIKMLERDGKISVADLARQFDTSRETIRRDLKALESQGVLTRTHGGAVSNLVQSAAGTPVIREYPVNVRGIRNLKEKQQICKKAVSLIRDEDIIFVDNSTTCLSILSYLPDELHVTILTNSIKFLTEAANYNCVNKHIYCLGGMYNLRNLSTYDTFAMPSNTGFYPDKCFISCNGISKERMITDGSIYEVHTKKQMIDISSEVYLLVDHTKFGMEGQYLLGDGDGIDYIIADEDFDVTEFPFLEHANVLLAG